MGPDLAVERLLDMLIGAVYRASGVSSGTTSVCVHQWPGVWRYVLPRMSTVSAPELSGSALPVRVCTAQENNIKFSVSAASAVHMAVTPDANLSVSLFVGEADLQLADDCCTYFGSAFVSATVIQAATTSTSDLRGGASAVIVTCVSFCTMAYLYGMHGAVASLVFTALRLFCLPPTLVRLFASFVSVLLPLVRAYMNESSLWAAAILLVVSALGSSVGSKCGHALGLVIKKLWGVRAV